MFPFKIHTATSPKDASSLCRPSHRGNADAAVEEKTHHVDNIAVVTHSQSDASADTSRPAKQRQHERNVSLTSLSEASYDESRDDDTDAGYSYSTNGDDTATYASSYISRDDSTYTRGTFTVAHTIRTTQLSRLDEDSVEEEEEEDDDHDDITLFSTDTDYRTLGTLEERDFARFVQKQQMAESATKGAASAFAGNDSTKDSSDGATNKPRTPGLCANLLDICGFLVEEMKDDPQDEPATKERSNASFEEELGEDDDSESGVEDDDVDDETLLDVYGDGASVNSTKVEALHSDGEHDDATEKRTNETLLAEDPAIESCEAEEKELDTSSKHKRTWNKIGRSLRHSAKAIIPRKGKNQETTEGSDNVEEKSTVSEPAKPSSKSRSLLSIMPRKSKKQEIVDMSCPADEFVDNSNEAPPQDYKSKSKRRASKMLEGLKKVQAGSQKFVQAAVMTTVAQNPAHNVQTIDNIASTKSREFIAPSSPPIGDSKDEFQAIPWAHNASSGGRSITKERFHQVITEDETNVKTIKKVKVGVDKNGNDKFAFLVFMSDGADDLEAEDPKDANHDVVNRSTPANQLVRGKMDDEQMELARARTESAEAMKEEISATNNDSPIILMEVDEMPKSTRSDVTSPISTFHPMLPTEEPLQDEEKSFDVLEALSFESSGHISNPISPEERSLGLNQNPMEADKGSAHTHATSPHELVLMELGDEDEIEIELDEDYDATTQTGEDCLSGQMALFPVSSDCAVAAFSIGSKSADEAAAVSVAEEASAPIEQEGMKGSSSVHSRRRWWKRKQGKRAYD